MASHLIQLLLPVADNNASPYPEAVLEGVKEALVEKFGGVTAFSRSPAQGVWAPAAAQEQHDDVVIVEVMADSVDDSWWAQLRKRLEQQLNQQEIVLRVFPIRTL